MSTVSMRHNHIIAQNDDLTHKIVFSYIEIENSVFNAYKLFDVNRHTVALRFTYIRYAA